MRITLEELEKYEGHERDNFENVAKGMMRETERSNGSYISIEVRDWWSGWMMRAKSESEGSNE